MAVLSFSYFSKARCGFVSLTAILPVEKGPEALATGGSLYREGPYPTIYLLHGYSGNQNDWLLQSHIENWATAYGYAVIMPSAGNSFYLDNESTGEQFGHFVGEELVGVTRGMFNLSHKREDTIIGGLSMGGFGALRNGLYFGDTFGAIIALSSALITDEIATMEPGQRNAVQTYDYYRHVFGDLKTLLGSDNDPKALAKKALKRNAPKLFMACGTEDFLYQNNLDFHQHLESIGYPHTWRQSSGVHDFAFWDRTIKEGMQWLQGEKGE